MEVVTWAGDAERDKVAGVNPMRQVPALVLPSGEVMTESAAILVWLGDQHPEAGLAPAPGDPGRAQYLRWMSYIPAAIYSLFWVRDEPSRLVTDPAQQEVVKQRIAQRIAECWRLMDAQVAPRPYLTGERLGLLDVYVAAVSRWTPRRRRFYGEAPRMAEAVRSVDVEPRLQQFWSERFPFEPGWEG